MKTAFNLAVSVLLTFPVEAQDNYSEVQSIVSKYYGEWNDSSYPGLFTSRVPNTALMGNGDIGVASGGNEDSKSFYISKGDFWTYRGSPVPIGGITIGQTKTDDEAPLSLAQGAAATASASHPDFPVNRMVSGNWSMGYEGWVSEVNTNAAANPFWAELDLGVEKTFNRIVIRHDAAARPAETANVTRDFSVSVRNNPGENWTKILNITGNAQAITDETLPEEVTARYIRLEVTKGTQETTDDSRNNPRARIGQFELYYNINQGEITPPNPVDKSLHEIQDILNAEVRTEFVAGEVKLDMRTFTAATENVMVTELTSKSDEPVDLTVTLWAKADNSQFPVSTSSDESTVTVTRSTPNNYLTTTNSHVSRAAMQSKIIGVDFQTESGKKTGESSMYFTIQPGQTVYVVTAVGGGGQTFSNTGALLTSNPVVEATNMLASIPDADAVQDLLSRHQEWWKNYWSASYVKWDTGDAKLNTIMKYYYAAQYLLGCTIREGKVAPGLYGIWHTTDNPSWNSDYHLNYNFISTFYGVSSSNRVEQNLPAIEGILQYVAQGKANASNPVELRNVRSDFVNQKIAKGDISSSTGISNAVLYPVGIGPWGMTLDASYHNEALNASYSAYPFLEYYNHTMDAGFLRDKMYDYLKLCVGFYEAWLEKEDGKYVLYAGYNEGSWAINPAVELSVLKSALKNLITASETLGLDADKRPHWQEILDNLAPQPVAVYQGKTVYTLAEQEWVSNKWQPMSNPVPGDGNIIPMEAVIPGEQVGYYSPQEQLDIAKSTIDIFSARGAWGQINNFPKIFSVAVNTRYPAQTIIDNFSSTINNQIQKNLMIEDNTHGVEKAGSIRAVNNMMLLSDQDVIKVFPNWISNRDAKFVGLRENGAFILSSEYSAQSKEVLYVDLFSEAGRPVTIASPWPEGILVTDESGMEVDARSSKAPNHPDEITILFNTQAGKTYHIVKSEGFPPVTKDDKPSINTTVCIYPNPAPSGSTVYVNTGSSDGGIVHIYDIAGFRIQQISVTERITPVKIDFSGVYLVVIQGKNEMKKTAKLIIQ